MAEVIVALDTPDRAAALDLVDRLGHDADWFKVGFELFTRAGPDVVRELRGRDRKVFLDLKLHDIPNTVARTVEACVALDVELLTVHAAGGAAMLEAAREAAGGRARILAVTLLTSLDRDAVSAVMGREVASVPGEVVRLAQAAMEAGADGVVASAQEAAMLRSRLGPDAVLVTPGIRPEGSSAGDQVRVATPADAVSAGSDYLVVGRPITGADDPARALRSIRRAVDGARTPG